MAAAALRAAPALATLDGNEAAARVAYGLSEVIAIYPITPSSTMAELADAWSAAGRTNVFGDVPEVVQMQSEAGAAGALHGAIQAGALATTFTASQGLLLMIPNMYKIAGELTPAVIHVAARTVAAHALSIFGDHSDVMAARSTGWAMLCSSSVQEAHDLALVAHATALESRVPFVHFFDGFRTSHEVDRIALLSEDDLRGLVDADALRAFRERRLTPERPVLRGSAQDPDVFFQMREAQSPFHAAVPGTVRAAFHALGKRTGRWYRLFDYEGPPDAEDVLVLMGSAAGAAGEAVESLNARGARVGLLTVRLFRPFDAAAFAHALPATTRRLAVLDRTKEPGAVGEPLYQDVLAALAEAEARARFDSPPQVIGGRYGLASKEFTPAMAVAIFDELRTGRPRRHFTVGIRDDVSGSSLDVPAFPATGRRVLSAVFYALGSDGTVGANRNTAKIVGEHSALYPQAYFVHDSRKAGSVTVSHLRFSERPVRSTYLIDRADFVACHQWSLLDRVDVLEVAADGGTLLLNAPYPADQVWERLPARVRERVLDRRLRVFAVDAYRVARGHGLGGRVNTVLQACFFALTDLMPRDEAIAAMKQAVRSTYGKRGQAVVERNIGAIDAAIGALREILLPLLDARAGDSLADLDVDAPAGPVSGRGARSLGSEEPPTPASASRLHRASHPSSLSLASIRLPSPPAGASSLDPTSDFVRRVVRPMLERKADQLPVSAFPVDGTFPTGTAKYERRALAAELPVWDPALCIDCGKCAIVCPHAAIRMNAYPAETLAAAPEGFQSKVPLGKDLAGMALTVQVAPDDCTGCTLCVTACPAVSKTDAGHKALNMVPAAERREQERPRWDFFVSLPELDPERVAIGTIKGSQLMRPLFEFSGACSGCGETPYLKLLTQLFGDRLLVANATGCSSIFGGNLPTTPWAAGGDGRGPAWSNSLFEDNAEFGLGMRLALDRGRATAERLLRALVPRLDPDLAPALAAPCTTDPASIRKRREDVARLRAALAEIDDPDARELEHAADAFVPTSLWMVGGDGWAYDIGFGGLDHVLASGRDVNVLVLDTEVYSNTGGQASKATPRGAVAKFAAAGKRTAKKDLGQFALQYANVYVAQVALGANDQQTVSALIEAERHPGPSLVIAYAPCIAQGFELTQSIAHERDAVATGHWPLYRADPARAAVDEPFLRLDSRAPSKPLSTLEDEETRFTSLTRGNGQLSELAQRDATERWRRLETRARSRAQD